MPYPMTHLYIAEKIMDISMWNINNKSQYYLGILSPDAVQFRQIYDKKISHLCNSNEEWGYITTNDIWKNDVIKYIKDNIGKIDIDFLLGFCIHILTDIYDNSNVLIPLRKKYDNFNELSKIILYESDIIDLHLFQICPFREKILDLLNNSEPFDFMNIVNKKDMENIINNIVNIQYNKEIIININDNKIITLKDELKFIDKATEYINGIFEYEIKKYL
jgi:hypothetical protein